MRLIFGTQLMEGRCDCGYGIGSSCADSCRNAAVILRLSVNHSGGKDSTRTLGFVRNKFRDSPTHVVMADTGFEHQTADLRKPTLRAIGVRSLD